MEKQKVAHLRYATSIINDIAYITNNNSKIKFNDNIFRTVNIANKNDFVINNLNKFILSVGTCILLNLELFAIQIVQCQIYIITLVANDYLIKNQSPKSSEVVTRRSNVSIPRTC